MDRICSKPKALAEEFRGKRRHARHKETKQISGAVVQADTGSTRLAGQGAMSQVKPHSLKSQSKDCGMSRIASLPSGAEAADTAASWPSWLTAVAADAISGWVPRRADTFEKLEKIGQGTCSSVYKARDLESGKLVAMKKVRFVNMDPESVRFMAREIQILRTLDHPNVMKLECLVTSRVSSSLYLVFEYMEHDLAGLASRPGLKLTESQIKCYMKQLFLALEHCHSRGVLHRDIKGSNLLIDNDGNLKIGDFGLATFFEHNQKQPLTSRVVTLWYRPRELLLGSTNYGVAVDLWSSGCILAELFHGKPIMPGRTEVEQLHKIFKLCGSPTEEYWQKSKLTNAKMFKPQRPYSRHLAEMFKNLAAPALTLLDTLLHLEPECRGSASLALESEFFTTTPLPCDPSNLPKYPPSKEYDARLRNQDARRQKAAAKSLEQGHVKKEGQQPKAVPLSEANPGSKLPFKRHCRLSNSKSNSECLNREENVMSGFLIEPVRGLSQNDITRSLQLLASKSLSHSCTTPGRGDDSPTQPGQTPQFRSTRRLFTASGFASSIGFTRAVEVQEKHDAIDHNHDGDIRSVKQDMSDHHHMLDRQGDSNKEDGRAYTKLYNMV